MNRIRVALAVVGALAAVTGGVLYAQSNSDGPGPATAARPGATAAPPGGTGPGLSPVRPSSPASQPPTLPPVEVSSPGGTAGIGHPMLLWPFRTDAEATSWSRDAATGGHQPWLLDPGQTALSFTREFLGFTEFDRVTSTQVVGAEAWIGVGYRDPGGSTRTAAVLHLVRVGGGAAAARPWEVVGSRDTTITLDQPRYGSTVGATLVAGGRITGVDECLVVTVRSTDGTAVGSAPGAPAGGELRPWGPETIAVHARPGATLTVVVSTGGHLLRVERFAVTGVTAAG
jgi:hypothetical protein